MAKHIVKCAVCGKNELFVGKLKKYLYFYFDILYQIKGENIIW